MTERVALGQAVTLCCGIPQVAEALAERLALQGFETAPDAGVLVVLDTPRGYALSTLAGLPDRRRAVVVTWSFCPEYLEDLWDAGATVLLVGDGLSLDLSAAIGWAARGERRRLSPAPPSPLTALERRVLRLLARGCSNQQIAAALAIQVQTVKNTATAVYGKIGVPNRSAAILYYWGVWDVC
ncbi:MAG TPA: LuxR C-terminal-related transcriptional regulator [Roseiflexaceae bacterium]|nr:LuxR C-terminal-related transcriptional regulator [Roseiflexaceae bacterium]